MKTQAVIFDMDGTLIDSAPGILRSARYALEKLGVQVDCAALREFIGPPLEDCFREVCGLPPEQIKPAIAAYREMYHTQGKLECTLYPGMEELLKKLHKAGKKVMLATSKGEETSRKILEHFDVAKYFAQIGGVCPQQGRGSKEDALAYVLAQEGISPQNAVMVGDRKYDIQAAKTVLVSSIGVLYGFGERAELEEAGADAIVSSVGDLAALLGVSEDAAPLTTVYLVRHAQPDTSVHEDAVRPLTPKGWADRERVTHALWDEGIDALYASPYKRAVDTIGDLAEKRELPIEKIAGFRERRMGAWISEEEFHRQNRLQWEDFSHSPFPDGESLNQVEARVRPALDRILAERAGQKVVIGGHGTAFSVLLHSFDSSFGYEEYQKLCSRSPWIVKLIFQGRRLLSRTELL